MTILTSTMTTASTWGFSWAATIAALIALFLMIYSIKCFCEYSTMGGIVLGVFCGLFTFVAILGYSISGEKEDGMIYNVDISTVDNWVELQENYDILEIDGLILTIKDKSQN